MTTLSNLDDGNADLARLADRIARHGVDPRKTLRRIRWAERWSWIRIVPTLLCVAMLMFAGEWVLALLFAGVMVPWRIETWRMRRAEALALLDAVDFFERERQNLERRVGRVRFGALLDLVMGAGLCALAVSAAKGAPVLWGFAAFLLVRAIVRLVVIGPALVREHEELGGELSEDWMSAVISVVILLLLPILLPVGILRWVVRRLLGRPVEDES